MEKVHVSTFSVGPVIESDAVNDFLDELRQLEGYQVDWQQSEYEPPAAGLSEIANLVGLFADSKELIIASWLLVDRYGGPAIGKLRRLVNTSRKSKETGRPYIPLMIAFGTTPDLPSVRFYFHGEPTEDLLKKQIEAMAQVLESLPEDALGAMPGPQEYG